MEEKKIKLLLKAKNIQLTQNRIDIINMLSDKDNFFTINDIAQSYQLNKKSVYDNIKLFIKKGLVDSMTFGGVPRYSLNDNFDGGNEIHIINKGKIDHLEIKNKIFSDIKKEIKKSYKNKKISSIKILVDLED